MSIMLSLSSCLFHVLDRRSILAFEEIDPYLKSDIFPLLGPHDTFRLLLENILRH